MTDKRHRWLRAASAVLIFVGIYVTVLELVLGITWRAVLAVALLAAGATAWWLSTRYRPPLER